MKIYKMQILFLLDARERKSHYSKNIQDKYNMRRTKYKHFTYCSWKLCIQGINIDNCFYNWYILPPAVINEENSDSSYQKSMCIH